MLRRFDERLLVPTVRGVLAVCLITLLSACGSGSSGADGEPGPPGPIGPPGPGGGTALTTGLSVEILGATIPGDRRAVVEFTMEDDDETPVGLDDLDRDPRFLFAWIAPDGPAGYTKYQSYVMRTVNGSAYEYMGMPMAPAFASAMQATHDTGGTFTMLAPGHYTYRFGTEVPPGYDAGATHTIGAYIHREDERYVSNPLFHFVPVGGVPTTLRDIVPSETCNTCHNRLEFHGGVRREVGLCVLCHTDQTVDPDSGAVVEFDQMIHKIHHGEELASPYYVVGFGGNVHDYSDIEWTQDTRHCTTCHTGGAQSDFWKQKPSRTSCDSCHDQIDWLNNSGDPMDPTYHSGGVQTDDLACAGCHQETSGAEFDRHIPGAHVVEYESTANRHLTLAITQVSNMAPGLTPTIRFTVGDDDGPIDLTSMPEPVDRVSVIFAGPTTDYTQLISQNFSHTIWGGGASGTLTPMGLGTYDYTPSLAFTIPMGASGTWAVGMEARTESVMVNGESIRFGANNPVAYVDTSVGVLGMGAPVSRREVIDEAKCDTCHGDLLFHGNLRTETEYCILCHSTWSTDESQRPGLQASLNPPESIDFRYMIHKIHRGADLVGDYTVYGFNGSEHDFTGIHFPGKLHDCETCHTDDSHELPLPAGTQAVVFNIGGVPVPSSTAQPSPVRPPATASCTSCHDDPEVLTHAHLNSIVDGPYEGFWAESCTVCHGPGSAFDASEAHANAGD